VKLNFGSDIMVVVHHCGKGLFNHPRRMRRYASALSARLRFLENLAMPIPETINGSNPDEITEEKSKSSQQIIDALLAALPQNRIPVEMERPNKKGNLSGLERLPMSLFSQVLSWLTYEEISPVLECCNSLLAHRISLYFAKSLNLSFSTDFRRDWLTYVHRIFPKTPNQQRYAIWCCIPKRMNFVEEDNSIISLPKLVELDLSLRYDEGTVDLFFYAKFPNLKKLTLCLLINRTNFVINQLQCIEFELGLPQIEEIAFQNFTCTEKAEESILPLIFGVSNPLKSLKLACEKLDQHHHFPELCVLLEKSRSMLECFEVEFYRDGNLDSMETETEMLEFLQPPLQEMTQLHTLGIPVSALESDGFSTWLMNSPHIQHLKVGPTRNCWQFHHPTIISPLVYPHTEAKVDLLDLVEDIISRSSLQTFNSTPTSEFLRRLPRLHSLSHILGKVPNLELPDELLNTLTTFEDTPNSELCFEDLRPHHLWERGWFAVGSNNFTLGDETQPWVFDYKELEEEIKVKLVHFLMRNGPLDQYQEIDSVFLQKDSFGIQQKVTNFTEVLKILQRNISTLKRSEEPSAGINDWVSVRLKLPHPTKLLQQRPIANYLVKLSLTALEDKESQSDISLNKFAEMMINIEHPCLEELRLPSFHLAERSPLEDTLFGLLEHLIMRGQLWKINYIQECLDDPSAPKLTGRYLQFLEKISLFLTKTPNRRFQLDVLCRDWSRETFCITQILLQILALNTVNSFNGVEYDSILPEEDVYLAMVDPVLTFLQLIKFPGSWKEAREYSPSLGRTIFWNQQLTSWFLQEVRLLEFTVDVECEEDVVARILIYARKLTSLCLIEKSPTDLDKILEGVCLDLGSHENLKQLEVRHRRRPVEFLISSRPSVLQILKNNLRINPILDTLKLPHGKLISEEDFGLVHHFLTQNETNQITCFDVLPCYLPALSSSGVLQRVHIGHFSR